MVKAVKDNMEKIILVCERVQVNSLYLFGSAGNERKFTKKSDLDFLYEFKKDENGLSIS